MKPRREVIQQPPVRQQEPITSLNASHPDGGRLPDAACTGHRNAGRVLEQPQERHLTAFDHGTGHSGPSLPGARLEQRTSPPALTLEVLGGQHGHIASNRDVGNYRDWSGGFYDERRTVNSHHVRSGDKPFKSELAVGVGAHGELPALARCDHDNVRHHLTRRGPDSTDEGADRLLRVQRGGANRAAQCN